MQTLADKLRPAVLPTIVGLLAGIFLLDLTAPAVLPVWALYLLPLWLTSRASSRHATIVVAVAASLLAILGPLLSPTMPGGVLSAAVSTRVAAPLVFALVGLLLVQRRRLETTRRVGEGRPAESGSPGQERQMGIAQQLARVGSWERDLLTDELQWSAELYRMTGFPPDGPAPTLDAFLSRIYPDDRPVIGRFKAQALETGRADGEYRFRLPDGTLRTFQAHAMVEVDAHGRPVRLIGATQDVTERRWAESIVATGQAVMRLLDAAPSLAEAGPVLLRTVAEATGWEVAVLWLVDGETGLLRCADVWERSPEATARFAAELRPLALARGVGLPGLVWDTGQPAWVADVAQATDCPVAPLAVRQGLRGVFAFPLRADSTVSGVLVLLSHEHRQPAPEHLEPLTVLGGQIGQCLARKQAEAALADKTRQLEAVTEAMSRFLTTGDWHEASQLLLRHALDQTGSAYGFIGVVTDGPALRILAHEGIVWDPAINRALYEHAVRAYQEQGYLEFTTFDNLFGRVVTTGAIVVANEPATDPRAGGLPPGHPPLRAFLGVPILQGSTVVGMIGVANRAGGYRGVEQDRIEVLSRAASVLYDSYRRRERERGLEEERRRAEATTRAHQQQLQTLIDNTTAVIFLKDLDGRYLFVNRQYETLFHVTRETIRGKTDYDLFPADRADAFRAADARALAAGGPLSVEEVVPHDDGLHTYIAVKFPLFDEQGAAYGVCGIATDITQRKQREQELALRVRQQAAMARLSQAALAARDLQALFDESVALTAETLGVELCKVLEALPGTDTLLLRAGVGWREGLVGHATVPISTDVQAGYTLASDQPVIVQNLQTETRFTGPPLLREHGVVSGLSVVIPGEEKPWGVLGAHTVRPWAVTLEDVRFLQAVANLLSQAITRRRAEEALRLSEASLAEAQRIAHLGNWDWNILTNELRWSEEIYRMFGLIPREFGATYEAFLHSVHPDDREAVEQAVNDALDRNIPYSIHHRIVLPDGLVRVVHERAEVTFDRQGRPIRMTGTVQDITDRMRIEDQLRQAQKMEAVGRLAGGVAHDFNNLLTVINGYGELVGEMLRPGSPEQQGLGQIRDAGRRAAALTQQLLAFGRRQTLQPRVIDLNAAVRAIQGMLGRLLGEHIALRADLAPEPAWAMIDPGQLDQVIMNLAVNARDAMPQGGTLTLETRRVEAGPGEASGSDPVAPGAYVQLAVADTGSGMDADTQARIFEPFFTTKERGKGTGLGLATVYGIVKQSGGFIAVESDPHRGSRFEILLPLADAPPAEAVRPSAPRPCASDLTVFIVEDEAGVRQFAATALRRAGYRVIEAETGATALKLAAQETGPIHLLVTDVILPGMSGPELARQLLTDHPSLCVLFMSGYAGEELAHYGFDESRATFLPKPFTGETLIRTVHHVLGA